MSISHLGRRRSTRRIAVFAGTFALSASWVMVATMPANAASFVDTYPCGTVLTTTKTSATVYNTSCDYARPGITRYYAGSPTTYWGALAPLGSSRSVTATNGTCVNHKVTQFEGSSNVTYTHSGC